MDPNLNIIIAIVLGIIILVFAALAIYHKKLSIAIIAAGAVSLLASIMYLLLAAPDVAMTEAAIGAGLSTVIFLYALHRTKGGEERND